MKEAMDELKNEAKTKLLFWNKIESKAVKVALVFVFIGLIALKVFTTVLTFDWLKNLFAL
ncbi:hypothetical protein [Pseudoalteromonas luteoviolacea]|uniref:Preprotein translocase subunit SecE n=1 Tax=Pseudoalteromonas luteoviolacea S4054 TaxID=1129367 RepID=A0A0F6A8M1_9GAMM|nr:hypothetical protein [Pseudoalteromonas luteoviolacea]AOT08738.1 hypothetical protein S4054249_13130 [Pseudoalteromonas luteoviolacea]AOT13653.1 hypothetical protein S40542_13105 [Pseudoalteromonas luteoviolacea]AOT18566.1 hypothetical protein S4054_13105 [Pseudoalteromonas luteoviolacea]KKE82562.1 hypothetical protein N479_17820 [Pseudoalteromonas luteoviolacea S4054]KZN64222.1 hypothetical protein N481_25475 [Pseudoalteromonas luteoviolacea S4047-1]